MKRSERADGILADDRERLGRTSRQARVEWLRTRGMLALLVILVVAIFILPAVAPLGAPLRLATDLALTLMVVAGIVAIADHRNLAIALTALGALLIVVRWSEWIVPTGLHPFVRELLGLSAVVMLGIGVGINVFGRRSALRDRIFGAIVLYLLLGVTWALIYAVVDLFAPQSFSGHLEADAGTTDFVYFSFVTLTTVGYGDIVPVSRIVRSLSMLEALVGQLYPAIIIARLISLEFTTQPDSTRR